MLKKELVVSFSATMMLFFAPVSMAQADKAILDRVAELQETARLSNSGALGCGVGSLILETDQGDIVVNTGLDAFHVFGDRIIASDLLNLLRARVEENRLGKGGPMSGKVSDLVYVSLSILMEFPDPQVIPVILPLLSDPDEVIRSWAVIALFHLGNNSEALRATIQQVKFPLEVILSARGRGVEVPKWARVLPRGK